MRIKGLLILTLALVFVLSGCWYGETTTKTIISQQDGGGTRTITVEVWKDNVEKPDKNGNVEDNSKYFPNGLAPVLTFLKDNVPSYASVTLTSDATRNFFNLTYAFNDFDQFKERTLELTGLASLPAVPTFSAEAADGGKKVTIKEDKSVVTAIVQNWFGQVYVDPDLFDPTHGTGDPANALAVKDSFRINSYTTTVGDTTKSFDIIATPDSDLTVSGFVSDAPISPNPETGDQGNTLYTVLALLAAAALVLLYINRKNVSHKV